MGWRVVDGHPVKRNRLEGDVIKGVVGDLINETDKGLQDWRRDGDKWTCGAWEIDDEGLHNVQRNCWITAGGDLLGELYEAIVLAQKEDNE